MITICFHKVRRYQDFLCDTNDLYSSVLLSNYFNSLINAINGMCEIDI